MTEGITDRTPIKIDTILGKMAGKDDTLSQSFYTPDREKLHSQGLSFYRVPLRVGRAPAYGLIANC